MICCHRRSCSVRRVSKAAIRQASWRSLAPSAGTRRTARLREATVARPPSGQAFAAHLRHNGSRQRRPTIDPTWWPVSDAPSTGCEEPDVLFPSPCLCPYGHDRLPAASPNQRTAALILSMGKLVPASEPLQTAQAGRRACLSENWRFWALLAHFDNPSFDPHESIPELRAL
jgi:hypothetical protein